MDLQYIEINQSELEQRLVQTQIGMSIEQFRTIMGGKEFETELRNKKLVYFWRFRVLDVEAPVAPYKIYMGEFEAGRFSFGMLLPEG